MFDIINLFNMKYYFVIYKLILRSLDTNNVVEGIRVNNVSIFRYIPLVYMYMYLCNK